MVKIDLHVHSFFSPCSVLSFKDIIGTCAKKGIDAIVLADHNRIDGALYMKEKFSFPVIVGEEISTQEGHLIGVFLEKKIEAHMPLKDTVRAIKDQGALVYIPHPISFFRRGISEKEMEKVVKDIDVIEVFNSRIWLPFIEDRTRAFAKKHNIIQVSASDAHGKKELGRAVMGIEHLPSSALEMKQLLKKAKVVVENKTPPWERSFNTIRARVCHWLGFLP